MKTRNILLALLVALTAVSCREEADYIENPSNVFVNNYTTTFTHQFQTIWNAVNTGYNFWDVTDVDWDARYNEYKPKFEALDKNFPDLNSPKWAYTDKATKTKLYKAYNDTLKSYYKGLVSGLVDHHMAILIRNPYVSPDSATESRHDMTDRGIAFLVKPSDEEIESRTYRHKVTVKTASGQDSTYYDSSDSKETYKAFREICEQYKNEGKVLKLDSAYMENVWETSLADGRFIYAQFKLDDGRVVPYLWLGDFCGIIYALNYYQNNMDNPKAKKSLEQIDNFIKLYFTGYLKDITTLPKEQMAGAILDVRENGGGAANDLQNMVGQFAGKTDTYWQGRHKEGMGRYDMSPWVPDTIFVWNDESINDLKNQGYTVAIKHLNDMGATKFHRDFAADNIPVVCLTDINSISCSEITAGSIQSMPTGYIIGERTFGGHGMLSTGTGAYNEDYCGVVGDMGLQDYNFLVYTSNFENRPKGQPVLEGIGIKPNLEVLYKDKGYKGQLDAALEYLSNKK